jgi:hypothetical protein
MTNMGKTVYLLCVLFTIFSSSLKAHDTYFSFAEVEYNDLNGSLEATLTVSTHDLEMVLMEKNLLHGALTSTSIDSSLQSKLEELINASFQLSSANGPYFHWNLEGIENTLTGNTNVYLSTSIKERITSMDVHFKLFMDRYPEQQNKLTFIYHNRKTTRVFLNNKRQDTITLTEL